MGVTHIATSVAAISGSSDPYEAEFLVDAGAIDCLAPATAFQKAGVQVAKRRTYELANGECVEFDVGYALIRLMGDETVVQVIHGPDDAEPILGVVAMEQLGLVLDPVNQTIKRLNALRPK